MLRIVLKLPALVAAVALLLFQVVPELAVPAVNVRLAPVDEFVMTIVPLLSAAFVKTTLVPPGTPVKLVLKTTKSLQLTEPLNEYLAG